MSSGDPEVLTRLAEQRRHQLLVGRARSPWWIPWLFVVGACVSILGVVMSVSEAGSTTHVAVFGLSAVFFGWVVVLWLAAPLWIKPRIVPYFFRELDTYGGQTMVAFRRGRALYGEIVALDDLARRLGVTPLSAFGFEYDHYDQTVRWHPASEGLRTVEALQAAVGAERLGAAVGEDLQALAHVLRVANDRRVDFSLVLRLHAKDSMQAVCTREHRQGSFW